MNTKIFGILPVAVALGAALIASGDARANDGRDRYAVVLPHSLVHWNRPVAAGAGFRVLPKDMPGGADGSPRFRWAQSHAIAVVQVAAYETEKSFGPGPYEMAVFDLSAENGDTPVELGVPEEGRALPPPPSGRHPGGSHDGGLNLDLGYYLTSLKGKVLEKDYAACTEHYAPNETTKDGKPRDAYMCLGPADRLDVDRQSYFVLQLLDLHRKRFHGHLLQEVGMDGEVLKAVRARLVEWCRARKYGVKPSHVADLDAIVTHDRAEGWQRFHHHHLHLRVQPFDPLGALRDPVRATEQEARQIRARLLAAMHPDWPAVLDARLSSYRLGRSIETYVAEVPGKPVHVKSVRYRMNGGAWHEPDAPQHDYRYVFELEPGPLAKQSWVNVVAEVTTDEGETATLGARVMLPEQDPRLYVSYRPGDVTGDATVRGRSVQAHVGYPAVLRPLVTSVTYLLYPAGGGAPERHVVDAAWFAQDPRAEAPEGGTRTRSAKPELPLRLTRAKDAPEIGLIQAKLVLSRASAVTTTLYVATP